MNRTRLSGFVLADEVSGNVPEHILLRRREIYLQLRELPDEAFSRLQYLQPAIGCFNRCSFCSQHAGTDVWQITRDGLRDLFSAVRQAVRDRPDLQGTLGADRVHKPRVLFPYLDNDIGSYPYLDEYIRLIGDLFGCRVRLTTVGFSAHNEALGAMHHTIATELNSRVAGVRFSVTPFTIGLGASGSDTSRTQFWQDIARVLALYRPLIDRIGTGKEKVSVELRFRPLVAVGPVVDTVVGDRHVIAAGAHLLVSAAGAGRPPSGRVIATRNNIPGGRDDNVAPEPVFSVPGQTYLHVVSDDLGRGDLTQSVHRALRGDLGGGVARDVTVYRMEHVDGEYYACDPTFSDNGMMRSLMIYPATSRRTSGYNDATRFFLNTLLEVKYAHGYGRRAEFPNATARDIATVLLRMRRYASVLRRYDRQAAAHLSDDVIPLVAGYARAVLAAGLSPSAFFSRRMTIDTGQAVNQGRGHVLFKGLLSASDIPANPWEERANAISGSKGRVWRIAPTPYAVDGAAPAPARHGRKNEVAGRASLVIEELDPRYVQPRDFETGQALRRYHITGIDVEHVTLAEGRRQFLFPGLRQELRAGRADSA
ncbi:hypothetical protein ACFWRG_20160 [Micromonospora tulbaghiae]|uniref:hypothetical protein n=1 Tax=Micromonospora tulbaghiae TaxID=479978 RepID=UPI00364CC823